MLMGIKVEVGKLDVCKWRVFTKPIKICIFLALVIAQIPVYVDDNSVYSPGPAVLSVANTPAPSF